MSTRCQVWFYDSKTSEAPAARIYIHHDGYPDTNHGVPARLERFFAAVEAQTSDTRFGDPEYLAAKFVVWAAGEYTSDARKPLAFLSVGIASDMHGDENYQYRVNCDSPSSGHPTVTWKEM